MSVRINYNAEGEGPPHDDVVVVDGPVTVRLPPAASMSRGTIIRHAETGQRFICWTTGYRYTPADEVKPAWVAVSWWTAVTEAHPALAPALFWAGVLLGMAILAVVGFAS